MQGFPVLKGLEFPLLLLKANESRGCAVIAGDGSPQPPILLRGSFPPFHPCVGANLGMFLSGSASLLGDYSARPLPLLC